MQIAFELDATRICMQNRAACLSGTGFWSMHYSAAHGKTWPSWPLTSPALRCHGLARHRQDNGHKPEHEPEPCQRPEPGLDATSYTSASNSQSAVQPGLIKPGITLPRPAGPSPTGFGRISPARYSRAMLYPVHRDIAGHSTQPVALRGLQ